MSSSSPPNNASRDAVPAADAPANWCFVRASAATWRAPLLHHRAASRRSWPRSGARAEGTTLTTAGSAVSRGLTLASRRKDRRHRQPALRRARVGGPQGPHRAERLLLPPRQRPQGPAAQWPREDLREGERPAHRLAARRVRRARLPQTHPRIPPPRAAQLPRDHQHGGQGSPCAPRKACTSASASRCPAATVRMDVPWGVVRPELDQIPGACKNWFTVQRYVDISNEDFGVTWLTPDAPLVEVGGITANLIGSLSNPRAWMDKIEPSTTVYSWAMNNHWHTNYRAEQEGPTVFRYVIWPHGRRTDDAKPRGKRSNTASPCWSCRRAASSRRECGSSFWERQRPPACKSPRSSPAKTARLGSSACSASRARTRKSPLTGTSRSPSRSG